VQGGGCTRGIFKCKVQAVQEAPQMHTPPPSGPCEPLTIYTPPLPTFSRLAASRHAPPLTSEAKCREVGAPDASSRARFRLCRNAGAHLATPQGYRRPHFLPLAPPHRYTKGEGGQLYTVCNNHAHPQRTTTQTHSKALTSEAQCREVGAPEASSSARFKLCRKPLRWTLLVHQKASSLMSLRLATTEAPTWRSAR
jgi:ribosomal protein S14